MPDIKTALRSCPLLKALPEPAFDEAGLMAKVRRFSAGQTIYDRGSMQSTLCIIAIGTVRVTSVNPAGREATLIIFDEGSWFGDTVFSPGMPRVYGVTAHEDATVIELPGERFRQLLAKYPESYPVVLDMVSRRLWSAISILEDDALRGVSARLGRRLLFLAEIQGIRISDTDAVVLRLTREQIANMMGMTRQGVHRRIKEFESLGLLRLDYGKVTITNPSELKAHIAALD
ncbi:transcriptional regulator, Crp/Fnr family [Marinobacter nitratireducens]|uniref:Transcriptional regulator, Crp/Fnr family n=1 Tax=Marinobacter nitratireducens TaxID=1137280 RepID=A0A072MZ28_9GAMM|nr:Crp/Fnr family transcriptional regulator [Marinobacter nitratireducens]KEF30664.1 transcriptional regulator, Crp/Fnr family [Marinobacter nitratireducens]